MVDDNKPDTLERLARAKLSDDLRLRETGAGDLDHIIALGAVALQVNPAASALLNLHLAHDATAYHDALAATMSIARKLAREKAWGFKLQELHRIAKAALHHHLCPVCPSCFGRGYEVQKGTPMLSDRVCPKCHGSGKRSVPLKRGREIRAVLTRLEMIEHVAEVAVRRKMKQR